MTGVERKKSWWGRRCGAAIVAVVFLTTAEAARGQNVRIWPSAMVTRPEVRIGDVASVENVGEDAASELRDVVIRKLTEPNVEVRIDLNDVRGALMRAGANLAEVRLVGASRCTVKGMFAVTRNPARSSKHALRSQARVGEAGPAVAQNARRGVTVDGPAARADSLEQAVREFLAKRIRSDYGRITIRFSPACRDTLSLGGPGARFDLRSRDADCMGIVGVEGEMSIPGQPARRFNVTAEVSLTRPVVVAKRTVNQGHAIAPGDVGLEERTFSRAEDIGVTEPASAIGRESRVFLRVGDSLKPRDLRESPLVRRGELVTVYSRRGGLEVKTVGRAAGTGGRGDVISIRREAGREAFEATITGPKTASVDVSVAVAAR